MPGALSFPPLLTEWKGASQGRTFPGGDHTRLKALEARAKRPLRHPPTKELVQDLVLAAGPYAPPADK